MASNLSQASVLKTYRIVIEETIASSREAFLDEGIDEQVLLELKQLWETKVANSKAVQIELPAENSEVAASTSNARKTQSVKRNNNEVVSSTTNNYSQNVVTHAQTSTAVSNGTSSSAPMPTVPSLPVQPTQSVQSSTVPAMFTNTMLDPNKVVPIQITLPPQPGLQEAQGRVLTIHVPATALIGNQLQQVLTGPAISATMGLPQPQASNLLQQHVNAALQGQNSPLMAAKAIPQVDGALDDSSDDEDDVSEEPSEDEEIDDDKEDEDPDMDDAGMEEEPLNSEDDVSEEDPSDLFDTDNVVVCQYDKINRSRNKWKFYLKDGIMNLNGKDFIFQKITGDAEW